ncbi:MAG: radical SAM protein [Deltaproteobacteria bacterium]|nr:radical SAM protein [Deltaproteobacteria bacterium]
MKPHDLILVSTLTPPKDAGEPAVYAPLRLSVHGIPAVIPFLQALAAGTPLQEIASRLQAAASSYRSPVLTAFYLSDFLRRHGKTTKVIPCYATDKETLREALLDGAHVVGISSTWIADDAGVEQLREAASYVRSIDPEIPIVVGGVGVQKALRAKTLEETSPDGRLGAQSAVPPFFSDPSVDAPISAFVLGSSGEDTLLHIIEAARSRRPLGDIPNLSLVTAGGYRRTPESEEPCHLDDNPIDWSLYPPQPETPVRMGTGCPHHCRFCDFTGLYPTRQRSLESVIQELKTLAPLPDGSRRVVFTDDNLGASRAHLMALAKRLIGERVQISWRAFLRADVVDADLAAALKESGCRECLLGIESGHPDILKNMKKQLDPDRALMAIRRLDDVGIGTLNTFIVGFPGETAATLETTAQFLSAIPHGDTANAVHRYYLFRFQVAPLAGISTRSLRDRFGLSGMWQEWSHKTMNSEEAALAVRDLFLSVRGPSHAYWELIPEDWSAAKARRVLEARDQVQKTALGGATPDIKGLLALTLS